MKLNLMVEVGAHNWITATTNPLTWLTPSRPSDGRGAGATETFNTQEFFSGEIRLVRLSEEQPRFWIDENDVQNNCIARAVRLVRKERNPRIKPPDSPKTNNQYTGIWDTYLSEIHNIERLRSTQMVQWGIMTPLPTQYYRIPSLSVNPSTLKGRC